MKLDQKSDLLPILHLKCTYKTTLINLYQKGSATWTTVSLESIFILCFETVRNGGKAVFRSMVACGSEKTTKHVNFEPQYLMNHSITGHTIS